VRDFYAQLIEPGELAFDVGANRGVISDALASVGARVVAIEPNPALATRLRWTTNVIAVEHAAVGAQSGDALLMVGRDDGHSTISHPWVEIIGHERFVDQVRVRVTTIDELIARYGVPTYIKIDVEGHEAEVLAGLSHAISLISFEFQCAAPVIAHKALLRCSEVGAYEYNLAILEERHFASETWVSEMELWRKIDDLSLVNQTLYGEVYARLISRSSS
jgi:FkbM family methyltransferase